MFILFHSFILIQIVLGQKSLVILSLLFMRIQKQFPTPKVLSATATLGSLVCGAKLARGRGIEATGRKRPPAHLV